MGRKCTWPGKYIHICIAFIISFAISGCVASVGNMEAKTTQEDTAPRWRFLKGDNAEENQKNLPSSEKIPSNDEVLFNTGLGFADPGNPAKDYNNSVTA
jgi:hypothetical protein